MVQIYDGISAYASFLARKFFSYICPWLQGLLCMRKSTVISRKTPLYFRRWARRGYAAFASLGRQVKICRLRTDMCEGEERKAHRTTGCLDEAVFRLQQSDVDEELIPPEQRVEQLAVQSLVRAVVLVYPASENSYSIYNGTGPLLSRRGW
mgnify:CR=1 FL=1